MDSYKVTVTDEKYDNTNKFNVKINKLKETNINPRKRKLFFIYFAWFTIFILMAAVFFIRSSSLKNESSEKSVVEIKIDNVELNRKENNIPFICLSVFCTVGFVCLTFVLLKDDAGIQFAKLNVLMQLQQEYDATKDYEKSVKACELCMCKNQNDMDCKNKCSRLLETKKNLYGELTKTLMNSISEI